MSHPASPCRTQATQQRGPARARLIATQRRLPGIASDLAAVENRATEPLFDFESVVTALRRPGKR